MIASSYSRMKDAQCPFRFAALHIERRHKEPENEAMLLGSAVHDAVAHYFRHCLKKGVPSDMEYLRNYDGPEEVKECLMNLADTPFALAPIGSKWAAVEARMAFKRDLSPIVMFDEKSAWLSKDTAFRLVVDFAYVLEDTLYVVDWKTGRGESDDTQTKIYGWLVAKHCADIIRAENVNASIVNLTTGKYETESWPVEEGRSIEPVILEHLETINSWTEFPAIPCGQCKWCTVPDCPVRDQALTALTSEKPEITIPAEITSLEDAERAVLFLLFAGDVTDRVSDLLRTYVETNGPVAAGGKIAELRPNTPWKCTDFEKLCRVLLAYGVESKAIWEHASMSESSLKKLAKKAGIKDKMPLLLAMGKRAEYRLKFGLYNDSLQK